MSPDNTQLVHVLSARFQDSLLDRIPYALPTPSRWLEDGAFAAVSANDVVTIVNALYPLRRLDSMVDSDASRSGLHSSSSSISGFSLFQNLRPTEPEREPASSLVEDVVEPKSSESVTPTSSSIETFSGNESFSLHSTLDSEQLRDACSRIEDALANASPDRQDQWCILLGSPKTGRLCTIQEKLFESLDTTGPIARPYGKPLGEDLVHDLSIDEQTCKATLEDILDTFQLDDYDPVSGAGTGPKTLSQVSTWILHAMAQRARDFEENSEFVSAHSWFRKLHRFNAFASNDSSPGAVPYLLHNIANDKERSLNQALAVQQSCDDFLRSMKPTFERHARQLHDLMVKSRCLRDKMWYTADVRTSAAYDEARAIACALRVMGKPKKPNRTRLAPPLRRWSGPKASNTNLHLKTEAQVLELLSAPPDYGGPNKLSDDQSKGVSGWMERNAVENFCRGEERVHRLCMEIRKAVDQLTADDSTSWSSALFAREKVQTASHTVSNSSSPFWTLQGGKGRFDFLTLHTNVPTGNDALSSTSSHPLSTRSSRDYLEARSPTLTNRSSAPFWSPAMTESQSPSSATSIGSSQTQAAPMASGGKQPSTAKATDQNLVETVRQHTTSLLLSDLASFLFSEGSETDRAYWTGLGGELTKKHLRSLLADLATDRFDVAREEGFDFEKAFERLIRQFSASCNPYVKLANLLDIDTLLAPYMAEQVPIAPLHGELQSRSVPLHNLRRSARSNTADIKVDGFRRLFCNSSLRPDFILRDLQYIAALVPHNVLETTPQGKAFWNAAVAISGLKQEVRNIMVETADSIIAFQSNNRGHGRSSSVAQQERDSAAFSVPSRTPSAEDIAHYTMSDAAHLLQITAKEGDAAAQRELATLYLTHPEQMDHVIAPFCRPRDVFKEELESKWRKNQDPHRCDPVTMCVAHHWMNLSSKGGDALAAEFLRQREEMERLP